MNIWSDSFADGDTIPAEFAFGKHNAETNVELAGNKNPHLAWSDAPAGTKSFVVICVDPDCPSKPDNVNKAGVTVSADLPRVDFYHWAMVDLAADATGIAAGELSSGVTDKGKPGPDAPNGRHGLNNYTQWFEGDADMAGDYFGYDGPCPPWNDELVHRYVFTVYALDVDTCGVDGSFTATDVLAAIDGHVLAEATLGGTYSIYPGAQ